MDITNDQEIYDGWRDELAMSKKLRPDALAEKRRDEVATGALIDIAESLRGLLEFARWTALEFDARVGFREEQPDPEPEREQSPSPDDAPLEPGDVVALRQLVDDGVALDDREVFTVKTTGVSDGAQWITVDMDGELGRSTAKLWADQYRRVPLYAGDEHDDAEHERIVDAFAEQDAQARRIEAGEDPVDVLAADFAPPTVLDEHRDREHDALRVDPFEALAKRKKASKTP